MRSSPIFKTWLRRIFWALLVLFFATRAVWWIAENWWFAELGYSATYAKSTVARLVLFFLGFTIWAAILGGNARVALRAIRRSRAVGQLSSIAHDVSVASVEQALRTRGAQSQAEDPDPSFSATRERRTLNICLVLSASGGLWAASRWAQWLAFWHAQPADERDPVFHLDLSFHLLRLPLWEWAWNWFYCALWLAVLVVFILYGRARELEFSEHRRVLSAVALRHFCALGAGLLVWRAIGYRLDTYALLRTPHELYTGAGYIDLHWRRPLYVALALLALACAAWLWRCRLNPAREGAARGAALVGGSYLAASLAFHFLVPALAGRVIVSPREPQLEAETLARHIASTRRAFDLHAVKPAEPPVGSTIGQGGRELDGLQLWPASALLDSLNQNEARDGAFRFSGMNFDFYRVKGELRPVWTAAREPAPVYGDFRGRGNYSWETLHLERTHGEGLAIFDAARTDRGRPLAYDASALGLKQTPIYFGAFSEEPLPAALPLNATPGMPLSSVVRVPLPGPAYVVLNSPSTNASPQGKYNRISDKTALPNTGVEIGAWWRRALLAWRFADAGLVFQPSITSTSRVVWHRRAIERCYRLAPFLSYLDVRPYPVISGGRVVWILDLFTTSSHYPYSRSLGKRRAAFNYVRSSVKATVDAYDGRTRFYVTDRTDPLARSYAAALPELFSPVEQMPADLRLHLRYPSVLLQAQAEIWKQFYAGEPQAFYAARDGREPATGLTQNAGTGWARRIEPHYQLVPRANGKATLQASVAFTSNVPDTTKSGVVSLLQASYEMRGTSLVARLREWRPDVQKPPPSPADVQSLINALPQFVEQKEAWKSAKLTPTPGELQFLTLGNRLLYLQAFATRGESAGGGGSTFLSTSPFGAPSTNENMSLTGEDSLGLPLKTSGVRPTSDLSLAVFALSDGARVWLGKTPEENIARALAALGIENASTQQAGANSVSRAAPVLRLEQAAAVFEQMQQARQKGDWPAYEKAEQQLSQLLNRQSTP